MATQRASIATRALWIGNLAPGTGEAQLRRILGDFGLPQPLVCHSSGWNSLGDGYVCFAWSCRLHAQHSPTHASERHLATSRDACYSHVY